MVKKMVAQVRYYETFYIITDPNGERVYTGSDAKVATRVLAVLNGVTVRQERAKNENKNSTRKKTRNVKKATRRRLATVRKMR